MDTIFNWPPSWSTILLLPALLVGFTVHELAHAIVAYLLGDTSQVERKRLTFNPFRHVSWMGLVAFLLIGFGWAKPVWVDYNRLRLKNRPLGMFLVSIAGVSANFLTALLVLAGIMGTVVIVSALTAASPWDILMLLLAREPGPDAMGLAIALSTYMVTVNLILAMFNMLPLPMMDGFQALVSLYTVIRNALKGKTDDIPLPGMPRRSRRLAPGADEPGARLSPAQIHFNIGLDYQRQGQYDEAIARYRQALAHDDRFALAYYNQGLVYWAKGRRSLAASAFHAAMQTTDDPNLHTQASLRLRELERLQQEPGLSIPIPPPLEPGSAPEADEEGPPPLDPEVERRIWLRLGVGGAIALVVTVAMWVYVTIVTLAYVS